MSIIVVKREGRVGMWHNQESGRYGVYLYEHEGWREDEPWLLFAIRNSEEGALEIFDAVASLLR